MSDNPRIVDLTITIDLDRLADPEVAGAEVQNAAYKFGCLLFERGGEDNRRPDGSQVVCGNGHRLAQEVAAMVGEYWAGRANR